LLLLLQAAVFPTATFIYLFIYLASSLMLLLLLRNQTPQKKATPSYPPGFYNQSFSRLRAPIAPADHSHLPELPLREPTLQICDQKQKFSKPPRMYTPEEQVQPEFQRNKHPNPKTFKTAALVGSPLASQRTPGSLSLSLLFRLWNVMGTSP
jgi:hypothetical protein